MKNRNIRMLIFQATAAATFANGGTAMAAATGDSLTLDQAGNGGSNILWHSHLAQAAGGGVSLKHYSGHDGVVGKPVNTPAGNLENLIPRGLTHFVPNEEALVLTAFGAATSGDVDTSMMLVEREAEGLGGRYCSFAQLREYRDRSRDTTVKNTLAAAAAGYGTEEKLNAETTHLVGGHDYALLGISADVNVAAVYIKGSETGNVKIGCPINAVDGYPPSRDFFCELSRTLGMADVIPVFSGTNVGQIYCAFVADENVTSLSATFHLSMLRKGWDK